MLIPILTEETSCFYNYLYKGTHKQLHFDLYFLHISLLVLNEPAIHKSLTRLSLPNHYQIHIIHLHILENLLIAWRYGERKTVWFPLEPDQLIPFEGQTNQFDAIYLTSYLLDDENYYMGEEWRQVLYNPENPENEYIKNNYTIKGVYEISANETYERE